MENDRVPKRHNEGQFFTPRVVIDIFQTFINGSNRVLIPFTAKTDFINKMSEVANTDILQSDILMSHEKVQEISKTSANVTQAKAIKNESYDFIIMDPPFNFTNGETKYGTKDKSIIYFTDYLENLTKDGIGIIIVPQSVLWRKSNKKWFEELSNLGFYINAIIEMPAGIYQPWTGVATAMLIVSSKRTEHYLSISATQHETGELVDAVKSFVTKGKSKVGYIEKLDSNYDYKLPGKLATEKSIEKRLQKYGYPVVNLLDDQYVLEVNTTRKKDGFKDMEGVVYLPNIGTSNAVTRIEDMAMKNHHNYFQLVINQNLVLPEYVAQILNSDLGRMQRENLMVGSYIAKINTNTIKTASEKLAIPLPEIEEQRRIILFDSQIQTHINKLSSLKYELWSSPKKHGELQHTLEDFIKTNEQDWIENITHPLAVILKAYYAENDERISYKHLLNFFEALSELIAAIYLGVLSSDSELFKHFKTETSKNVDLHELLKKPTFGSWYTLNSTAAKYIRDNLEKTNENEFPNRKVILDAFAVIDNEIVVLATNKKIINATKEALDKRNQHAHGGIASIDTQLLQNELTELDQALINIQQSLKKLFKKYKMISVEDAIAGHDEVKRHYSVNVLEGTSSIFYNEQIALDMGLAKNYIYMREQESSRVLRLFPLIKFEVGPKSTKNTPYFYNKYEGGSSIWKAYQFTNEPEVKFDQNIIEELPNYKSD